MAFQASPGAVDQYVMTQAQYETYFAGGPLFYLAATSGTSGTFTTPLPSGGTYQVVSCHASGWENTSQTGVHTTTVRAIATGPFVGAVVAFVVGAVLVGVGLWFRTKPPRPELPPYAPCSPYPYGPAPPYQGAPIGPAPVLSAGWPAGYGMIVLQTLLVRVESASATDASVQILVNGVPAVTLPVAAGKTAEASVHTNLSVPPGAPVRVEAVTAAGVRATHDVTVDASGGATASLRIG